MSNRKRKMENYKYDKRKELYYYNIFVNYLNEILLFGDENFSLKIQSILQLFLFMDSKKQI